MRTRLSFLRGALACTAMVAATALSCGGESDDSTFELDQLPQAALAEPVTGTALGEEVIDDSDQLWEAVRDTDFADGWKGGYRAAYVDVQDGITRAEVSIDVYKSERAAEKRTAAERRLNEDFFKERFSSSVAVEEIEDGTGMESCSGLSVKQPAIVPQYQVYCRTGTAVVFARAIASDEEAAIELVARIASGIARALEAVAPPES